MHKIDFLPERITLQRARRRNLLQNGYMVILFVAGLAMVWYVRQGLISTAYAELEQMNTRSTNIHQLNAKRGEFETELTLLRTKESISKDLGSRINAADLLVELQKVVPDAMAITALRLETVKQRVKIRRAVGAVNRSRRMVSASDVGEKDRTISRFRLRITGLAPVDVDVANFIGQLSASPLFEDVSMGYSKNTIFRGRKAREFQADCYVTR